MDLLVAGMAILLMPHWEGKLFLNWLKLALKIEGSVQTLQLTPVEMGHLQYSRIREIIDAEALHTGKLKRRVLLLRGDVKEDAIGIWMTCSRPRKSMSTMAIELMATSMAS